MREREAGVLLRLLHKSSSATLPQAGVPVTAAAAELSILPEEVQLLAALINEKAEPLIHSPVIELCGQPGKLRLSLSAVKGMANSRVRIPLSPSGVYSTVTRTVPDTSALPSRRVAK